MKIGYLKEYDKNRIDYMSSYGIDTVRIEEDGKSLSLINVISNMSDKDVLVVYKLDFLNTSLQTAINYLKELEKKDAGLQMIEYPINMAEKVHKKKNRYQACREDLLKTLLWVDSKNRQEITLRKRQGLELIKEAKNRKGAGRPKKYSSTTDNLENRQTYFSAIQMLKDDIPIARIADVLNISRHTVYSIKEDLEN